MSSISINFTSGKISIDPGMPAAVSGNSNKPATAGVNSAASKQNASIAAPTGTDLKASSATAGTAGTNTTKTESAADAKDRAAAKQAMADAIQQNKVPEERSGLCNSNTNAADVSKQTGLLTGRADALSADFDKMSGGDAMKVAAKFIEDVKVAKGRDLSAKDNLALRMMVSESVHKQEAETAKAKVADTSVTAAAGGASGNSQAITITWGKNGIEITLSDSANVDTGSSPSISVADNKTSKNIPALTYQRQSDKSGNEQDTKTTGLSTTSKVDPKTVASSITGKVKASEIPGLNKKFDAAQKALDTAMAAVNKAKGTTPAESTSTDLKDISWSDAKTRSTDPFGYSSDFPDLGNRYYMLDNRTEFMDVININIGKTSMA